MSFQCLGPSEELRLVESFSCALENVSITGDHFCPCFCVEGFRHCFLACEPSEELRLGESFNLINKSRHFVVLVTSYDYLTVLALAVIMIPA